MPIPHALHPNLSIPRAVRYTLLSERTALPFPISASKGENLSSARALSKALRIRAGPDPPAGEGKTIKETP